jgi:uncharacterized protein (UPF0248 family)
MAGFEVTTEVIVALFMAGYYVWRADHVRLIPQLKIQEVKLLNTPVTRTLFIDGKFLGEEVLDHRTYIQLLPKCLTEAPVYECKAYLKEVRRCSPTQTDWEDIDFRGLVLRWDNSEEEQITQHPGVEKSINVAYIQHSNRQIVPSVFGDIPMHRIVDVFDRRDEEVEAYQFDVYVARSDRVRGENIKPAQVRLEVHLGNDPSSPSLELTPLN